MACQSKQNLVKPHLLVLSSVMRQHCHAANSHERSTKLTCSQLRHISEGLEPKLPRWRSGLFLMGRDVQST